MIETLYGRIFEMNATSCTVIIECGGVGYGCRTSYNTLSALGAVGSEAVMYTYLYVREDVVKLFGFATLRELSCFKTA